MYLRILAPLPWSPHLGLAVDMSAVDKIWKPARLLFMNLLEIAYPDAYRLESCHLH